MTNLNPTKIVNKKNVYIILSLVLLIIVLVVAFRLYKSHLAGIVTDNTIKALKNSEKGKSIDWTDPVSNAEAYNMLKKYFMDTQGIKSLYKLSKLTDEELNEVSASIK
jgi:TRAP-type uncharacterized transport system fused permease subunit